MKKNTVINKIPTEEELIKDLLKSEEDIKKGRTTPANIVLKEWSEKYGI